MNKFLKINKIDEYDLNLKDDKMSEILITLMN